MYFKTFSKSECCACTACEHACPVQAITFTPDYEGFMYPSIDSEKCINCGLCERVCPVEHPDYSNSNTPYTYAAMVTDIEQRKNSSSGGMFYVIASWVLRQGGKVYGATIDRNHQVYHIGIDNENDLELLRGSKYVQSDLRHVFCEIKDELKVGRWIYFVGTGCQVAGLKAYLRKDYGQLVTSDLVCHGVPSQWLFDQHINYLTEQYDGNISDYQFRDNENWSGCEIFKVSKKGKIKVIKNKTYFKSPYLNAFTSNYTLRYSCYNCKFSQIPRQGDITLADFWGVENFIKDISKHHGVSMILINTHKGDVVFNSLKHECEWEETELKNAIKYNANLTQRTELPEIRRVIYDHIKNRGYKEVASTLFKSHRYYKTIIVQMLLSNRIIKKVLVSIYSLTNKNENKK